MARKRLALIAFAAALLAVTSCSDSGRSLANGFEPSQFNDLSIPYPPDNAFRALMRNLNMSEKDIDCMVRETFGPPRAAGIETLLDGWPVVRFKTAELQEIADRCNVDFSRMSVPNDD
jgi:hypothetical protein